VYSKDIAGILKRKKSLKQKEKTTKRNIKNKRMEEK